MLIIVVPIIMEIDNILKLWLGNVPEHTATFTRLCLCGSLIMTLGNSLYTGIIASGKIRKYQIIITIAGAWVFPLTYLAFKLGMPAESAYIIYNIVYFLLLIIRASLAKGIINLNMRQYIQDVILKAIYIAAIVSIPPLAITFLFEESILRTFIAGPLVLLTTITIIYFILKNQYIFHHQINCQYIHMICM
jgi:hypothetical protein